MLLSKRYTIDAKKPLQVGQPVRLLNRADSSGGTANGVVVAVKRGRVESLPMRADIAEAPVTAQADSSAPIPEGNHAQYHSGLTAAARAAIARSRAADIDIAAQTTVPPSPPPPHQQQQRQQLQRQRSTPRVEPDEISRALAVVIVGDLAPMGFRWVSVARR